MFGFKALSEKSCIMQSDLGKLENGTSDPLIKTLQVLADGMGKVLSVKKIGLLKVSKMKKGDTLYGSNEKE